MNSPREVLEMILGHLGFVFDVEEIETPDGLLLQIHTRDPGRLIGRDGKTIEELQFLVNRIAHQTEEDTGRVMVDVEGYRLAQRQELEDRVRGLADKIRAGAAPVTLEPMNSYDRRIVHNCLKGNPDVITQSPSTPSRLKRITIRRKSGPAKN